MARYRKWNIWNLQVRDQIRFRSPEGRVHGRVVELARVPETGVVEGRVLDDRGASRSFRFTANDTVRRRLLSLAEILSEPGVTVADPGTGPVENGRSHRPTGADMTAPSSEQDVVDLLTSDHREVLDLLRQITSSTDPARQRDLMDTVISELVRHSVAEEMFVYPAMRKHLPDGKEAVEHDVAEHKELEQTMKKLEAVDAGDAEFRTLLGQLEEILRDHVADEETEQFPRLRAAIPRADLVDMAEKVRLAKEAAPTRPHPLAPNNQVFHKLVGPGVGLVDRLRDALSNRNA